MTVPVSIQYTAKQGYVIPSNCKVMALCDDTAETVTGTELMPNPPPITTTTSWTSGGDAANTTLSVSATRLRATSVAAGSYTALQNFVTVTGKRYAAYIYVSANSLPSTIQPGVNQSVVALIEGGATIANTGVVQIDFTAASASTDLYVSTTATAAGQYFELEKFSIRLVDDDISGNDRGLPVYGSLIKSAAATNSTTMAYGPFSTSNYLHQLHNPALEFGTSAFHAAAWFKCTTPTAAAFIFEMASWSGSYSGSSIQLFVNLSGNLIFLISDDGHATSDSVISATLYDDNAWHFAFAQFVSNVFYLYVDGALIGSATAVNVNISLSNASANLRVGLNCAGTEPAEYLSGFRIGTGSFTAAKIKADYDKEKTMFRYGGVFAIDGQTSTINLASVSSLERRAPENIGETNVALDGTAWGVTDRIEQGWAVTTDVFDESARGTWEHFFRSCKTGESFTFDSHGTSTVPVDALTHKLLPGAKISRVSSTEKFRASFEVVEINA